MNRAQQLPRRLVRMVNVPGTVVLVAVLAVWQLLVGTGIVTLDSLPAPSDVLRAAGDLLGAGDLQHNVVHTLEAMLIGWAIGAVIGLVVGCVVGLFGRLYTYSMASFDLLRSIPGVTLAPVSVLLFGYSTKMEVVLIAFVAVWPVLVASVEGTRSAPPAQIDVARTLRMSRVSTVRKVILPNAFPSILVALRISLAVALALAIVAEIVGNPDGIGAALTREQNALEAGRMFAYVIAASLLGLLLNAVLVAGVRLLSPGTHAAATRTGGD